MAIVAVGNLLARSDSAISISDIRAGLTDRGLYICELGNQSLGDYLGALGLGLPSRLQPYLRLEAPDTPPPKGWRRVRDIVHRGGMIAYVQSRRVYTWPEAGVDRAYLELKFVVPSDWDWSKYDLT